VLLFHVTTKIENHPHDDILSKKGGGGFPYVAILDGDGDVLAPHGYEKGFSPDTFRAVTATAKENGAVKARAASGDAAAKKQFFLLQLGFGTLSVEAVKTQAAGLDFTPEEKAKVDDFVTGAEVSAALRGVNRNDPATLVAAGKQFNGMYGAGRVPKDQRLRHSFFFVITEYAKAEKDIAAFEKALGELSQMAASNPRMQQALDKLRRDLDALKAGTAPAPAPGGSNGGK